MRRLRVFPVAVVAVGAVAGAVVLASSSATIEPTAAAARPAPGLYGIGLSRLADGRDFQRMANGGGGTVRFVLDWRRAQPHADGPYRWGQTDRYVKRAAKHGLAVLPVLYATPGWLSPSSIKAPIFSAEARRAWHALVHAAVARYGADGSFWAHNPDLPYDPVRDWQIWNEQNSPDFWAPAPSPSGYLRLLAISESAIHRADPGAKVALGGMFETGTKYATAIISWRFLARLYHLGGRRLFDIVGVHPYSPTLSGFKYQVRRIHRVIRRHHDSGTQLWIDEIGWGSGRGGSPLNKGPHGQARILRQAFRFARRNRRRLDVGRIIWFPWRDSGHTPTSCTFCGLTGLIRSDGRAKPSWGAFRRLAR